MKGAAAAALGPEWISEITYSTVTGIGILSGPANFNQIATSNYNDFYGAQNVRSQPSNRRTGKLLHNAPQFPSNNDSGRSTSGSEQLEWESA